LSVEELELLANRTDRSRLGLAVLLSFFQVEGRFPRDRKEFNIQHTVRVTELSCDLFKEFWDD
jgi:hypothetical protein